MTLAKKQIALEVGMVYGEYLDVQKFTNVFEIPNRFYFRSLNLYIFIYLFIFI